MKTQKLQFVLTSLYDSQKDKKLIKKCPTLITKLNRKIQTLISKSTKVSYLLLFINNSDNSRLTSCFRKSC